MTIQVYLALIASLLIVQWTGQKPTKRLLEMLCLYFQGWASEAELLAYLQRLHQKEQKKNTSQELPNALLAVRVLGFPVAVCCGARCAVKSQPNPASFCQPPSQAYPRRCCSPRQDAAF